MMHVNIIDKVTCPAKEQARRRGIHAGWGGIIIDDDYDTRGRPVLAFRATARFTCFRCASIGATRLAIVVGAYLKANKRIMAVKCGS